MFRHLCLLLATVAAISLLTYAHAQSRLKKILTVDDIQITLLKSNPPQLTISAVGTVSSGGWSNGQLVEYVYIVPPSDGMYEYDFVAEPPDEAAIQVLTPIFAGTIRANLPKELKGIRVRSSTNSREASLSSARIVQPSQ